MSSLFSCWSLGLNHACISCLCQPVVHQKHADWFNHCAFGQKRIAWCLTRGIFGITLSCGSKEENILITIILRWCDKTCSQWWTQRDSSSFSPPFILVLWLCCFGLLAPVILSILSTRLQLFSVRSYDKPTVCCQQWVTVIQVCEDWTTWAQDKGQKQTGHTKAYFTFIDHLCVQIRQLMLGSPDTQAHNRRCLCRSLVEYFFSKHTWNVLIGSGVVQCASDSGLKLTEECLNTGWHRASSHIFITEAS